MLVIALDTSTPAVTAGLVALGAATDSAAASVQALSERVTVNPRAHGELLTPHLLDVLTEAGHGLGDADAIVVGAGPGPFTGLRAGMVTAAGLGHALDKPVYPVCSLDGIAASCAVDGPLLVATDARRNEVYWSIHDAGERLTGPAVARPEDVAERLAEFGVRSAAGEKASLFDVPSSATVSPSAEGLVRATAPAVLADDEPEPLVPLYLRRPDAQEPTAPKPVTVGRERR
ncbi:tRNA (adenosine(37)-N6)-threonylcarbamoyltransferase complex dimerization subunit type 1 TsaB [Allosaccharopolyspora coralli]|uniref:tRNA (Adenosine(37)-N6)-threonylcarbamoyltransferase complex dimerization subunit type 1 TsaB n=1 Tax=Allosaccharopolyspora coralli TaxID=2665642 RepID=A0A5Q3QAG3_9PSEU|nr:tRNA (adenosine(37)-N6)-threonylcarbamoyltransferase complex dimerization subunit type 1 TsaB [Allosaccharopolyspora coralli]QGK71472.1 tRNA (adenosine(37)-N6)-threonylcarbamoyltransferase complex dimerization subunit type 1 TsaB [Allosaccharopolyspora coralli]